MIFHSLLLFACSIGVFAQTQPSQPNEKKYARITGKITNARTGEPLRKVSVLANLEQGGRGGSLSVTTDAEGRFLFDRLETGSYQITATRNGFLSQRYSASGRSQSGTVLKASAGQEVSGIDIKLMPQGVLAGKVLDSDGDPMLHAQVNVFKVTNLGGKRRAQRVSGGTTNDLGEFRIFELDAGRYYVLASKESRSRADGSSQPKEDYIPTYYPGTVDPSGASMIDLEPGQENTGLVIQLRRSPVFRVNGRIANLPVGVRPQSVNIMVSSANSDTGGGRGGFFGGRPGSSNIKGDGTFTLSGLAPGNYQLIAMRSDRRPIVIGKQLLTIGTTDLDDVIFPVSDPVRVAGLIRYEDKPPTEAAGRIVVELESMDPMPFGGAGGSVKPDGTFVMEQVSRERFRLTVSGLPDGYYVRTLRSGNQDITDLGFDLSSAGSMADLEVILSNKSGSLGGSVKDEDKTAIERTVTLIPDPIKPLRPDLIRRFTTLSDGTFQFNSVAPGDYRLYAWEEINRDLYTDPDFLKKFESSSVKVSVKEGSTERVELKIIRIEERK